MNKNKKHSILFLVTYEYPTFTLNISCISYEEEDEANSLYPTNYEINGLTITKTIHKILFALQQLVKLCNIVIGDVLLSSFGFIHQESIFVPMNVEIPLKADKAID